MSRLLVLRRLLLLSLVVLFLIAGEVNAGSKHHAEFIPQNLDDEPPKRRPVEDYSDHSHAGNVSVVHKLMDHLFSCYHKAASLVQPVVVQMEVLLIKVKGTVEREGIFESVVAVFIRWHDSRLMWDPAKFSNITALSLDVEQVGLPDIVMTNSADHLYSITRHPKFIVRLTPDGYLKYVPTGTARTWCDLKLFAFPFDVQKCSLEFESWSLDHKAMTFDGRSRLRFDTSFTSQLWTICKLTSTTYNHMYFTNETFSRVRFDITVVRKSTFYVVNLIFPCTTLSMIQLLVFVLSSIDTTADRIGFSTTNLLTLVVFQTIVTEELPKTSDAVTALSKYVIALIVTSAIGIFESVVVERIMTIRKRPPPMFIYRLFKPVPLLWRELPHSNLPREKVNHVHLMRRTSKCGPIKSIASLESPRLMSVIVDNKNGSRTVGRTYGSTNDYVDYDVKSRKIDEIFPLPLAADKTELQKNGLSYNKNKQHYRRDYSSTSPRTTKLVKTASRHVDWRDDEEVFLSRQSSSSRTPSRSSRSPSRSRNHRRRHSRRHRCHHSSDKEIAERKQNAYLWMELAYRIDTASFTLCLLLSVLIPIALFAPPIYFGGSCEHTDFYHF